MRNAQMGLGKGPAHCGRRVLPLALALAGVAHAAPLDPLLSADAPTTRGRVELTGQVADARLDRLGLTDRSGDSQYRGTQLRLQHGGDRWLAEAALWRHRIDDRGDPVRADSWLLAGQWRLNASDAAPGSTDWALRGSVWGSQAERMTRRTSARLTAGSLDSRLESLELLAPRDRQWQLDLIGSRRLPVWGTPLGSAFVGLGRSQVDNAGVQGRARVGGCPYTLHFGPTSLQAVPTPGCSGALIIGVPNALLPLDAANESRYAAQRVQLGGSVRWSGEGWSAALGYSLEHWRRDIDPISQARGSTTLRRSQSWIGEGEFALDRRFSLLMRVQLSQHRLLSELPAGYNTFTATRYEPRGGLLGVGLQWSY